MGLNRISTEVMIYAWAEADLGHFSVRGPYEQCPEQFVVAKSAYDRQAQEIERLNAENAKLTSAILKEALAKDRLQAALLKFACNCGPTDHCPSVHREDCEYRMACEGPK